MKGRKRDLLVDTQGFVLGVCVTSASVQDRDGAKRLLERVKDRLPRLTHLWADGGYRGGFKDWVLEHLGVEVEIVSRTTDEPPETTAPDAPSTAPDAPPAKAKARKGFKVLPRRWVVERTFAWGGRYRRLSKDYETTTSSSETVFYLAMTQRMLRHLRPARAP